MSLTKIWKVIPHYRVVDDQYDEETTQSSETAIVIEGNESYKYLKEVSNNIITELVPEREFEYRDEAERKWWSFFNEYEYRINKFEATKHKWWYWYDKGTSEAEKKLLFKLDILIAFYVFIVYWVKSLDQSNIANAYVSGMKEDLNMKGNDYINTVTVYNVAAVVFQLPFMYLFPRVSLHYIIPILDLFWGVFTLGLYRVNSTSQLQALRFFVGAFEAAFYPAAHYAFGSWYKSSELARRGAIFYFGQMVGTISSGLFQAAIYKNLDGNNGLGGWRWMFIIDGLITIPIGLLGFFVLPGTPYNCYSIFLTDDEIRLSRKRLKDANINPQTTNNNFFNKKLWIRILSSWKVYILSFFSCLCWNNTNSVGSGYILWLKSLDRYSVPKVNSLSTITPAIGIVLVALTCGGADLFRSRYGAIAASQILNFIGNTILAIWNVPESAKWFAFMVQYAGWAQASVMYSWMNDILRHDPQERAITFLLQYSISQSTSIWITRLAWPTISAPRYLIGYTITATFAATLFFTSFIVLYFYKREERKNAYGNGIVLFDSRNGDVPSSVQDEYKGKSNN